MRFSFIYILIVCLFSGFSALGQLREEVRLQAELKKAGSDSVRVDLLAALSKLYYANDGAKAVKAGQKALKLARQINYQAGQAMALNNIGGAYYMLGDFPAAAQYHFKALEIRERIHDSVGLCATYVNLGNVYNYKKDTLQAFVFYKKSLLVAQKINNSKFISMALNNIGNLHERANNPDKAIFYYNQALRIKRQIADTTGICVSLNNLGNLYIDKIDFKKALPFFEEAHHLATYKQDDLNRTYALRGLAQVYHQLKFKNQSTVGLARESLKLSYKLGSKEEIRESAGVIQEIYAELGDYQNAHHYLNLYQKYGDSIITETGQRNLAEMQVKYETEKKGKENIQLKAQHEHHLRTQERNRYITIIGGLALISLIGMLLIAYRSRLRIQKRNQVLMELNNKIEKQKAELTTQAGLLAARKTDLEKTNALKDKMFSVISHDLRSPLNALRDFIYLLEIKAVDAEEMNTLIPFLKREISHTANLMENLLIWTKNQMQNMPLFPRYVNIYDIAEENINLFEPQARNKNIIISNNLNPVRRVFADEEMVKFIIRNLLANAIKFTNQNGIITLDSEDINSNIAISVTDNGKGMAPAELEKLFRNEHFSTRGTANEKGSGLGLNLCREFLERNHGTIKVTSSPGKGSTFTFTLPVLEPVLVPAV